jgi:phosphoglycerol transferase MdoB-like AlkP superfamily enzyme
MLLDCYRSYIGDLREVSTVDVFTGAGLTASGLVLALVGWGLFVWSEGVAHGTETFWTLREVSVAVAGVGVPIFLLGVVVLLVGNDRITAAALLGVALCFLTVVLFVVFYPDQWNVPGSPDYVLEGVTLYAVGVLGLAFAAGAAFSCRVSL